MLVDFSRIMARPVVAPSAPLALLVGIGAAVGSVGCDEPTAPTPAAQRPSDALSQGPSRSRRSHVDPEIWARFGRHSVQRVIVEVADPLGVARRSDVEPPSPSMRARQLRQRRSDLTGRKQWVLERLAHDTGRAPAIPYRYDAFRLFALEADEHQVRLLERMAEVTAVFADREEKAQLAESLPYCRAPAFHQSHGTGSGTAVAVLDTPIRYDRSAFGSCPTVGAPGCSVVEWLSFADESSEQVMAKEDEYGKTSHGTNVGAIVLGVAPDTALIGLNVFHSNDTEGDVRTYVSDQIEALDWVASHAASHDIVAVNMSLGASRDDPWPCNYDDARYDPIRTLRADYDILTAVASGNSGEQNAVKAPGCLSMAVTVGAQFDTDLGDYPQSCSQPDPYAGEIACFSNLSGMLDLVAPGVHVDAAGIVKSGTSMATPHVAGAIAAWQSWFLAQEGTFKNAPWMHRRLLAGSTLPLAHADGRRFARLTMADASFDWSDGHAFTVWHREADANLIPSGSPGFEQAIDVTGKGYDVASVYLYLEVVHLSPEDVAVSLESPSGATATVSLPGGQAHFNGIIGRLIEPGAFTALAGSPADGTWTLSLRDTETGDRGHYIQAAVFFVAQGCAPSCDDEGCGDDRCGGSCGALCEIEGACYLEGSTQPADFCWGCVPSTSPSAWSPVSSACDDGDPCTDGDSCSAGQCFGAPVACPPPGPCEEPGRCDSSAGHCVYPHAPDGQSCDDGNPCTGEGTCQQGACLASLTPCAPPDECRQPGVCTWEAQQCVYAPVADGTECTDGVCEGGVCTAGCSCSTPAGAAGDRLGWSWLLLLTPIRRRRRQQP